MVKRMSAPGFLYLWVFGPALGGTGGGGEGREWSLRACPGRYKGGRGREEGGGTGGGGEPPLAAGARRSGRLGPSRALVSIRWGAIFAPCVPSAPHAPGAS